jgi:biotin transporter BioY
MESGVMMFIIGWLLFSIAAGMFAHIRRNRNGVGWFFVAMLISPLVAFVLLAILHPDHRTRFEIEENQRRFADGVHVAVVVVIVAMVVVTAVMAAAEVYQP